MVENLTSEVSVPQEDNRKHFRSYSVDKGGHTSSCKDTVANCSDRQIYRSIILLITVQIKVILRSSQTQRNHSITITRSNLYKGSSSRHYECKRIFTEEFQSILELQNHQIPKVKTGLANNCNNNWRHLSDSRQSTTPFSTQ